ncbi:MAG: NAD(P)-binding protein [Eubacteriales bacterium]
MDKRAIIIGTGLAGLIAGAYLSRDGFSVELFEQRDEIGGVTSGYRKNGYYWDLWTAQHRGSRRGRAGRTRNRRTRAKGKTDAASAARLYHFPDFTMTPPAEYGGPWWRKDFLLKQYPSEKRGINAFITVFISGCGRSSHWRSARSASADLPRSGTKPVWF